MMSYHILLFLVFMYKYTDFSKKINYVLKWKLIEPINILGYIL